MKALKSSTSELWEKCLQWIVVYTYVTFLLTAALTGWFIFIFSFIFFPLSRYPLLLYLAWMFYDRKTAMTGKRRSSRVRNWWYWKLHNDYFPHKLHKTVDLPPDKNYFLCVFPHGIISTAAFCAFGNDHGKFTEVFPGLTSYLVTLAQHFTTPFVREYAMSIGALPASFECLNYFLRTKKNVAVALLVGGAHEAFFTKPGVYCAYVMKRKGFVKIAYKTGASLVPTVSFGENDIYDQFQFAEGSLVRRFQILFKKVTGLAPVLFYGSLSVAPIRRPLNVVVGKPIPVEKIEEPTSEQIDSLHSKFIEELTKLFESEKHKYIENAENVHMEIL